MATRVLPDSTRQAIIHLLRQMLIRSSDPAEEAEIRRVLGLLGVFNT